MAQIEARFPPKLRFLFRPHRYKVAYGGRGSGKSWSFARALLIQAAQEQLRVLCTREVQKSIKDSVHRLLSDQIQALGLGPFYEVLETEIRGANGSLFLFAGLSTQTAESIKSYEGVDRVWVEEAQAVSKRSWDILTPTIRKAHSEIWISFNPELDTDETYRRFVTDPPTDCAVVSINFMDNPWFPPVLEQERQDCERKRPEDYPNIWLGRCKAAVEGAIYATEIAAAQEQGRVRELPHDPLLKTHLIFDLGWNDSTSVIFVQSVASELRVIDYLEDSHRTLAWYSDQIRGKGYGNWGTVWLPHDGQHKNLQTGRSSEDVMRALGWDVQIVPPMQVEEGIRNARLTFVRTFFDKTKTAPLVEHLKRYRRAISSTTNEPGSPLHDEHSHGADAWRYLSIVADQLRNEKWGGPINYSNRGIV